MSEELAAGYPVDGVNRVKRRQDRGFYDYATVHALLDAAAMCHLAYVVDGIPYCTPTLFWREGGRLYWHGSNSSRMLRTLSDGGPTCLAERLPIRTQIGTPEPCPRLRPHGVRPPELDGYRAGRSLEEAVAESHLAAYPYIENRS